MKKYANLFIVYFFLSLLLMVILYKTVVKDTIIYAITTWFYTLVPTMAPMIMISDILINYNLEIYLPKKLCNFIGKGFNISKEAVLVFLLSLISGFPSNVINIVTSYKMKKLTREEAEHLLLFCNFANPLFVLSVVGDGYLKSSLLGILILISHILANITIGIIFRWKNNPTTNYIPSEGKSQSLGKALTRAIDKTVSSLLMVAGTTALFLTLSNLVVNIFHLNLFFELSLKGIMEMTMALSCLAKVNLNKMLKAIIATIFISFSGLSVHLQVYTSLSDNLKYKNYLIGRCFQVLIAVLILLLLTSFIKI